MANNIKRSIEQLTFLDNIIVGFARSKKQINLAYELFAKQHGYDLRKPKSPDYLEFSGWEIKDNNLVLWYHEMTPHDIPYGIHVSYPISSVSIITRSEPVDQGVYI